MWILYPEILLNLIILKLFWWHLQSLLYMILSTTNSDSFSFSFSMWIPFFSGLFALARTFSAMVNRNGEMRILVLFLILKKKLSDFCHYVSFGLFIQGLYYVEVCSLHIQFVQSFYKWIILSSAFATSILMVI